MDEEIQLMRKLFGESPYRVEAKISEGAYGQVYKVIRTDNQQRYALKVIDLSKVSKLNKMHELIIEIKVLKGLQHPGVIRYVQTIRKDNYMGLITELAPYGDLFSFIATVHAHPQLSKRKYKIATFYLAQVLQIIDHIHDLFVIHRDIKPENFVMGVDLRLRIIDFATSLIGKDSKLINPEQMNTLRQNYKNEGLVGSANYLSPQSLKLQYSDKSDIWAFGVLAYKFFFNKLPFQGSNQSEIFSKIVEEEIDLLKADSKVEELLVMCLKKDPQERATAKMAKLCSIFKDIDFKDIFYVSPPVSRSELPQSKHEVSQYLLDRLVQKKMFFGNFKPRLLTISISPLGLKMAYRYTDTKQIKNQFDLTANDYASVLDEREFEVKTKGNSYIFRVGKEDSAERLVHQINHLIRERYKLE